MSASSGSGGPSAGPTDVLARELEATLHELLWLALAAKQLHWSVVGPRFLFIHRHFDELAASWLEQADIVGERSLALGLWPDGQARTIARKCDLREFEQRAVGDAEALALLADRLETVRARCRRRIRELAALDAVSDPAEQAGLTVKLTLTNAETLENNPSS